MAGTWVLLCHDIERRWRNLTWMFDSRFRLLINKYSSDGALWESNAQVSLARGNAIVRTFKVPTTPTPAGADRNKYKNWHVCGIHGTTGEIRIAREPFGTNADAEFAV